MKKDRPLSQKTFGLALLLTFSLAGVGQFFLAQKDLAWTLWPGLVFWGLSLFPLFRILKPQASTRNSPDPELSPGREGILFAGLTAVTIFFRAYKINDLPDGIFADRAEVACGALRILHDHWRPFLEALSLHVPELNIYYLAAGWFKLFGSSPEIFSYFDVFLSTAGVLLAYGVFRQWSGPKTALLSFYFLAVMRWNFVFAHKIYYQSQTVFFMMLALLFLLLAKNRGKQWWAAAGFFLAAGLYSYQALKAVPLFVLLYMFFEFRTDPPARQKNAGSWLVFWLSFLCFAAPLLGWMSQSQSLGRREAEVSVFTKIKTENNLWPLWTNLCDGAAIFNRRYDTNGQSNFGGRRMLDDVMGVLFILGLAYAASRLKEKPYFYAAAGLGVMSLPALLSENGGHAGRMLGMTPFIAYLCARLVMELGTQWKSLGPAKGPAKFWGPAAMVVLLGAAAFLNFHDYFLGQIRDPAYLNDFSWPETKVGQAIAGDDGKTEFFLPSRFYDHPTVKYLAGTRLDQLHRLETADPPRPDHFPRGKAFCFLLDDFKIGILNYLEELYPGGETASLQNPLGETGLNVYKVSASALGGVGGGPRVQRGLQGSYYSSARDGVPPFLERWDPVINFTFRDLPLMSSPLFIRWKGRLKAPRDGFYDFLIVTYEKGQGKMEVDGNPVENTEIQPSSHLRLKEGWHALQLTFRKTEQPIASINLLWKKPGDERFEFISNDAFGPVH